MIIFKKGKKITKKEKKCKNKFLMYNQKGKETLLFCMLALVYEMRKLNHNHSSVK